MNGSTHLRNWQSLFLLMPSQMNTNPSEPPVANVLYTLWNASALTGYIFSVPSSFDLWHLNAYFFFWISGFGSRYSTATRPDQHNDRKTVTLRNQFMQFHFMPNFKNIVSIKCCKPREVPNKNLKQIIFGYWKLLFLVTLDRLKVTWSKDNLRDTLHEW
jgi:hypothetical protein